MDSHGFQVLANSRPLPYEHCYLVLKWEEQDVTVTVCKIIFTVCLNSNYLHCRFFLSFFLIVCSCSLFHFLSNPHSFFLSFVSFIAFNPPLIPIPIILSQPLPLSFYFFSLFRFKFPLLLHPVSSSISISSLSSPSLPPHLKLIPRTPLNTGNIRPSQ